MTTYYYSLTTDQTNTLVKELDSDLEFIKLTTYFMMAVLAVSSVVMYYSVVLGVGELVARSTMIMEVISYSLLERNLIIKSHLKNVSKGGHLYKI
jgi:hypothetical protein